MVAIFVLLLGVGAGFMNIAMDVKSANVFSKHEYNRRWVALTNARQSLISYATVYPYLYGPASAGPGHLPCPDTDGFTQAISTVASGRDQRRDGPNPPCGSTTRSLGHLPRHTVLPGYRYLFHSQPEQRLRYEVDAHMINNPVNRVVNLSTLLASAHAGIASVSLPPVRNGAVSMKVAITANALIESTVASVAAWVIDRSNRLALGHCVSSETVSDQKQSDVSGCKGDYVVDPDCRADALWFQLLDYPLIDNGACIVDQLKNNLIEGIPAQRHWFVRNQWSSSVMLYRPESCVQDGVQDLACQLSYPLVSRNAIARGADVITLRWNPVL